MPGVHVAWLGPSKPAKAPKDCPSPDVRESRGVSLHAAPTVAGARSEAESAREVSGCPVHWKGREHWKGPA